MPDRASYLPPALSAFLLLHLLAWLAGSAYWLYAGYEGSFLHLNAWRMPALDLLMPHLTHLGDGLLAGTVVGLLLLYWQRPALVLTVIPALLTVAVLVWLGKFVIFRDWHRPIIVFLHREDFYYTALTRLFHYAFPSGHSAAAAGAATLLVAGRRSLAWGVGVGLLALLTSYTRLYIGVHFLGDIVVGSLLGVTISLAYVWGIAPRLHHYWGRCSAAQQARIVKGLYALGGTLLLIGLVHLYWQYYR